MRRRPADVALLRRLATDRNLSLRDASAILGCPIRSILNVLVEERIAWAGKSAVRLAQGGGRPAP